MVPGQGAQRCGNAVEDLAERGEGRVSELRAALATDYPALGALLPRCAVLIDGRRTDADAPLTETTLVDVLPPFAGG